MVGMSKQQTGLRIDRVLFKSFNSSAPWRDYVPCERGLVGTD